MRHYSLREVIFPCAGIASLHCVPVAMRIYDCVSPIYVTFTDSVNTVFSDVPTLL